MAIKKAWLDVGVVDYREAPATNSSSLDNWDLLQRVQPLVINECFIRNRNKYKYILISDTDEALVPLYTPTSTAEAAGMDCVPAMWHVSPTHFVPRLLGDFECEILRPKCLMTEICHRTAAKCSTKLKRREICQLRNVPQNLRGTIKVRVKRVYTFRL